MPDEILQRAELYARRYELQFLEQLGSGIHGLVLIASSPHRNTAVKLHRARATYLCEAEVYRRLYGNSIVEIHGLSVPELVRTDDELLAIEMTIVTKPYVLDFAGVSLDQPPDFSQDIWEVWEEEKREQFGPRWRDVLKVTEALELLGIYLTDISPSNVAFE